MRRASKWVAVFLVAVAFQGCASVNLQPVQCQASTNAKGEVVALAVMDGDMVLCKCGDKSIPPEGFHSRRAFRSSRQCEAKLIGGGQCVLWMKAGRCNAISAWTQSTEE